MLRVQFSRSHLARGIRWFSTTNAGFKDESLKDKDPEVYKLIAKEKERQRKGIVLIASENFSSKAVNEAVGSCLTNKYAEGYIGARFYPGWENVDQIEQICQDRALKLFKLNKKKWHANVQPCGGSAANIATYNALLQPGEKLMALSGKSGGHFSHGFQTPLGLKSISRKFFDTQHYGVNSEGLIDYDEAFKLAKEFNPKLIICGYSLYPRDLDYKYLSKIAKSVGAYLHLDMAHISGLISAGIMNNPFKYIDVATTTTHKSLRGPRGGMILCKKELATAIDESIFPGIQGGPQNHTIAGLAVALKEANSAEFKNYQKQVLANARALAKALAELGFTIRTGGTDNHMVLWDLRPQEINSVFMEKTCNFASITLNPIRLDGATDPNAVRVGSLACTTRGYKEENMADVAAFLGRALERTLRHSKEHKEIPSFVKRISICSKMKKLKKEVEEYAEKFEIPGI